MWRSRIFRSALVPVLLIVGAALAGCGGKGTGSNITPQNSLIVFHPPNVSFAHGLGIMQGPVTEEQARAIAAAAAGGTAGRVEQEDEDGTQVFGVEVQTAGGMKDVKVRISDGAVMQIDDDDDAEDGDGDHEGDDDD